MKIPSYWTNIELFFSGDQYFSELISSFRQAHREILIEVYIFNLDNITRLLMEELRQARTRGVHVQILVDGFGSMTSIPALSAYCQRHQIDFRAYQPFLLSRWVQGRIFWTYLLRIWRLLRKLNHRNHRKIVLIDRKDAYVGSLNWTQVHSRKVMNNKAWRDSAVKVEGSDVQVLHSAFRVNWNRAHQLGFKRFRKRHPLLRHYDPRKSLVRLNTGWRDRWRLHRDLLRKIRSAQTRVWLTTAYFLPHPALIRALKKAALRGVSVQIIVPGPSDVPIVKWAAFEMAQNLLKSGVEIFEFQTSILHAKSVLIDNWATVGSTNLNYRSVFQDLEAEIVMTDTNSLQTLEHQWLLDLKSSRPFNSETYSTAPWARRLIAKLLFRLRYLL